MSHRCRDGEGSFYVSITKNKNFKLGWQVRLFFAIELHYSDADLLKLIKKYFNEIGSISENKERKYIKYEVSSLQDLAIIKNHFLESPMLSNKRADFEL